MKILSQLNPFNIWSEAQLRNDRHSGFLQNIKLVYIGKYEQHHYYQGVLVKQASHI